MVLVAAVTIVGSDLGAAHSRRPIDEFSHKTWTSENGLAADAILALLQSRTGHLWIGTRNGLARFDGLTFTVYDRANTPDLAADRVQALLEGRDGSLWIGTTGGLTHLANGRFRSYTKADGLGADFVYALGEDRDGHVWVGTSGGGVSRFDGQGFTTFTTADGLDSNLVRSLMFDDRGTLWVGTSNALNRFERGRFARYDVQGLLPAAVSALAMDRVGNLWIGTNRGLGRVHLSDGTVGRFTESTGLINDDVRTLYTDSVGDVWIGTMGGLSRHRDGSLDSSGGADGPGFDLVRAVIQDREGSYWVGTDGRGLTRIRDAAFTAYGEGNGLPSESVYCLTGDPTRNALWAGLSSGEVYGLAGDRFTLTVGDGLDGSSIRALLEDRRGTLWIATDARLYRYSGARLERLEWVEARLHERVRVIFEDRDGRIWLGGEGGVGVIDAGRLQVYTTAEGLADDRTRAILQDVDGSMWIGGYSGLSHFTNGQFTNISTAQGLSNPLVRSLYQDEDRTLWIGTLGGGLNRLRDGQITSFRQNQGLTSDTVYSILEDGHGHLWMSSDDGVFEVNKTQLDEFAAGRAPAIESTPYGESDGMPSRECQGGGSAGWQTPDGRFWFPTRRGIAMVGPDPVGRNREPPPLVLEQALVDGRPFVSGDTLPAGSGRVEFQYAAPTFLDPERTRFTVRLEGFDNDEIDAGTQRAAVYTNLPPRSYRFVVSAVSGDGVWNRDGTTVDFTLEPYFYQTSAFYALSGVALLGLGIGVHGLLTLHLRRRQRLLQAGIDEAVAHVKVLRGMLPICSFCKKIRDDSGYWNQIESYLGKHSEAEFSHSLCPDCLAKHYPEDADGVASDSAKGDAAGS